MKKNINNKKAKFYCENCGEIVSQNAKVCTKCGRFFSSVRCPRCGRVGTNDDFVNGCKDCGYAFTPTKNIKQKQTVELNKPYFYSHSASKSEQKTKSQDSSLPLWIYIFTISVLILVFVLIFTL